MPLDLRQLVFHGIKDDPDVAELIGERIYQRSSTMEGQPPTTTVPYLVYHLSDESPNGPSALRATARHIQVWVHDMPGDYYRIDQVLDLVKLALEGVQPTPGFMEIRFIQKSPDLYDDMLKHIVRYSRFQASLTV